MHLRRILGSFGASTCILRHLSLRIQRALAAIRNALMRITCACATSLTFAELWLTSDARVCSQNAHRCTKNRCEMQWNASVFPWCGVCAFYVHSGAGCLPEDALPTSNMHSCAFTPRSCAYTQHSCAFTTASCKRWARLHKMHTRMPSSPPPQPAVVGTQVALRIQCAFTRIPTEHV